MSIKSIKIKNLLSFDELIIDNFEDINCIVGKNNAGKSNLLKLLRFFYVRLEGKRELPPKLYSNYSAFGTIKITYSISYRVKQHLKTRNKNYFPNELDLFGYALDFFEIDEINEESVYELTLKIHSNDAVEWSTNNQDILKTINYLYPFFDIEARHIDLYNWDKLWDIISSLKSFNLQKLEENLFYKEKKENEEFDNFIELINSNLDTKKYSYGNKLLSFIKAKIQGDRFVIGEDDLTTQSDGTNAHKFIESSLKLLFVLTKREYITPIIYIDEPEIGLHPKKNEELIESIYETYIKEERTKEAYPTIIFATHSPNIVKQVIKLFNTNQQILHFSKKDREPTVVQKMNSQYEDNRFLNVFSDNEARLFFSNFILFVEGATEVEIFRNQKLNQKFGKLKMIDVYEAKESMLKYINPSYSNVSIPYLVLYDADKFMQIDFNNKKIVQPDRGNVINHVKLEKKYKKTFFKMLKGDKKYLNLLNHCLLFFIEYKKKNNIDSILKNQYLISQLVKDYLIFFKKSKIESYNNLFIDKIKYQGYDYDYELFIEFGNRIIFSQENKFFNKTTIEEVLINENSFAFFKKWFYLEFKASIEKSYNDKTPTDIKSKKIRKKLKEIKEFKQYFYNAFNKKDRVIATILIFGGKTETSITVSTKNYNQLSEKFRNKVKKSKESYIQNKKTLNLGSLLGKTSGWATSFLNFSIDEIEKNRGEEKFKDEFKKYFRELYDIISIIDKKL